MSLDWPPHKSLDWPPSKVWEVWESLSTNIFSVIRGGQSGTLTFFWNRLLTSQHLAKGRQLKKTPCMKWFLTTWRCLWQEWGENMLSGWWWDKVRVGGDVFLHKSDDITRVTSAEAVTHAPTQVASRCKSPKMLSTYCNAISKEKVT